MDIIEKIQLGEFTNVDAVNVDNFLKIFTTKSSKNLVEYNIQNILDVTQVFDDERQNTDIYRLHGEIEYLSVLNNIPLNYTGLTDFFSLPAANIELKDILTDFRFYLLKSLPPTGTLLSDGTRISTGFTEIIEDQRYIRNYEVISELNNFEIYNAAYSTNIFNEQQHIFSFNNDFDISNDVDSLSFPITQLYLYCEYVPKQNGLGNEEILRRKRFNNINGNDAGFELFNSRVLTKGDVLKGDVINFNKNNFEQTNFNLMEYQVDTPYGLSTDILRWIYKPFIPITIRVFSDDLERVNTGSTSFQDVSQIPFYAIPIDNEGNFVWRNLLDKGFIDPLTGNGVNFPFINNKHYIFENTIISIEPQLDHPNTANIFNQILFENNELISTQPSSQLDNINEKCL